MDDIQIANILLTRRCNLRCSYCRLVRDLPEVPEYPLMDHYKENELDADGWIDIIARLKNNNPDVFLVIYGGEPFLYNDLPKVLNYCHEANVHYTVISNNTDGIQKRIESVCEEIGGFYGFTSSVDPLMLKDGDDWDDVREKSRKGFERLKEMKESGKAKDVVAEITAFKSTLPYLYDTVKLLSDNGIYSSITTLDQQKNKYYDFSTISDTDELVPKDDYTKEVFKKIQDDESLLIHIPELLDKVYDDLPCNMRCNIFKDIHNVTIDADGSLRLCLRIRGIETPKYSFKDLIDEDGVVSKKFNDALEKDYEETCDGCIWTCMYMSGYYNNSIIDH